MNCNKFASVYIKYRNDIRADGAVVVGTKEIVRDIILVLWFVWT